MVGALHPEEAKSYSWSKYWNRTHKYGIDITKNVNQELELNKNNGSALLLDSVDKEIS